MGFQTAYLGCQNIVGGFGLDAFGNSKALWDEMVAF